MVGKIVTAVALALCGVPGMPGAAGAGVPVFVDGTADAQLTCSHEPSPWLLVSQLNVSSMLGGGAVGDFNNDGFQDIFFLSGGVEPDRLLINQQDGTFQDQAAAWGVAYSHMGVGTAVGDFNADGWLDVFVTSLGPATAPTEPGHHLLYRNDGGTGFTNVAGAAGVAETSTGTADGFGATFGDHDGDGDLDLFVTGWVAGSGGNVLFRNDGGTFTNATAAAGLSGLTTCRGFSPRFVDMNGDRRPELLIAADFGTSRYYVNDGDGTFTDFTAGSGTGLDGNGMGHAVGDFDGNGLLDWYVTSIYSPHSYLTGVPGTGNMLYLNLGNHLFVEASAGAQVNDGGWGWGTVAVDVGHDGALDLVETNGWTQPNGPAGPEWDNEPCYLFLNTGSAVFVEAGSFAGLTYAGQGRGLASLDVENDGDQDLLFFSYDEPLRLYRNDSTGLDRHWLGVQLDAGGVAGVAPQGLGAIVTVQLGGQTQLRSVDAGSSYLVQSETTAHFGLGSDAVVDRLTVHWANGLDTHGCDLDADRTITISPHSFRADLDGDGSVGAVDFLALLAAWGACPDPGNCPADLNCDDQVDVSDFLDLLTDWD